jgi:hypothetical protein
MRLPVRSKWPWAGAAACLLWAHIAFADTVAVPVPVQVNLSVKLAAFDRALPERADGVCRVFIVTKPGDVQSTKVANEFLANLKSVARIAGLPHEEQLLSYEGPNELVARIRQGKPSIVYLSAGFSGDAATIGNALNGVDVLTIAAEPSAVSRGVAVGFDLVSGQPKLLINLAQARRQNVRLAAAVLQLAVVIGA